MPRIARFKLFKTDLPFRKPFKHAAAERSTSDSLFLKCELDDGTVGWGESLPRRYVSNESRDAAFELLRDRVLPRLINREFSSFVEVRGFLSECDGLAPSDWIDREVPQTAAWCAVDLALLDAFGKACKADSPFERSGHNDTLRYSAVLSADTGAKYIRSLLKVRLYNFRQVKLKVEKDGSLEAAQLARKVLGARCDIRADANMAWTVDEAIPAMKELATCGITPFEQPLAADDMDGAARLVEETKLDVMADEGLHTRESLHNLIQKKAITSANIRVSKCGGLVAALNRCRQANAANLKLQVGCQVGESSLLSAAHVVLLQAAPPIRYAEGCFGRLLLREDPAEPLMQFGYGGRRPLLPKADGLGVTVNEEVLRRHSSETVGVE